MSEYLYDYAVPVDMTDEDTGEIKHGIWIPDKDESRQFVRYFCKHTKSVLVGVLLASTDKKMNILAYLIDCMNPSDNRVAVTYKKISSDTGIPESTVNNAMNFLRSRDYVRIIQNGLWMINPDLCMKGYESKYLRLYREYMEYSRNKKSQNEKAGDADA